MPVNRKLPTRVGFQGGLSKAIEFGIITPTHKQVRIGLLECRVCHHTFMHTVLTPRREFWLLLTLAGIQFTHVLDFMIMFLVWGITTGIR